MAKTIRVRFLRTKEGNSVLDLKKYAPFYGDEALPADSEEFEEHVDEATSINAIGKESLAILKRYGVDVSAAKKIGGHATHPDIPAVNVPQPIPWSSGYFKNNCNGR